jgi:hypothetical protein
MVAADFWTVSGWVMTVVFGVLSVAFGGISVWQFLRDLRRDAVWDERARHLVAVKNGMVQLES